MGWSDIISVTADPANRRVKIVYRNDSDAPQGTVPTATVWYNETRRAGHLDRKTFSRDKGTHTMYLKAGGLHVVDVEIGGVRGISPKNYPRLMKPETYVVTRTMTAASAAAGNLAVYIPGAVLTLMPQTRVVRFLGSIVLGWTIFDVAVNSTGTGQTCPAFKAGQVYSTKTNWRQAGNSVKTTIVTKMWHTKRDYLKKPKSPVCTKTNVITYK